MAGKICNTTARIVRILVDCGMVASEELEIVRCLIVNPASTPDSFKLEAVSLPAGLAPHRQRGRLKQ